MKQLTLKERYYIEIQLKKKTPVKQIAKDLGYTYAAIYREIKKGTVTQLDYHLKPYQIYLSDVGQRVYDEHKSRCGAKKKYVDSPDMQQVIQTIKQKKYSPSAARYVNKSSISISTIYNYARKSLLGLTVYDLPYAKPKKKKDTHASKRIYKPGACSIEDRPEEILSRNCFGHWEMDTVYSSRDDKTCLLVLSERMTRKEIVIKCKDRTADSIIKGLNKLERRFGSARFRDIFRTITCDNGVEFSKWQDIERSCLTKKPRTKVYFCHPYSSYERGTNENINRMIRRWIPKGDDIGLYTDKEIKDIENWINDYPRMILGGKSSNEYFNMFCPAW